MAELFSQVLDLKKKDVFLETKENDTIYFSVTGLPSVLSYGKHPFSITFNDPDGEPLLKNLSNIVFEFIDSRGTVIFSSLIDIKELSGAGSGFIWIKKDPLRTADEIADGPASLHVMGELGGKEIPNEWQGIYNVRTSFTYDIRKDFPNTSPLVLSKPLDIQTNLSISETVEFDDSDTVYKRSFINITLSDLETNGGKIESVELAYNEQKSKTDDFDIITSYPLTSGSFETDSQTLTSGLNPITNTTKIPTPKTFRRNTPVKFRLRFLSPSKQLAQYLDEDRQGEIVEVTSSFITFDSAPFFVEKTDNLLTGSLSVGRAVGKGFTFSGKSSAELSTVDYKGFTSASLGLGPGIMMFSGSVKDDITDDYALGGVGLELVANSESFFRFRTNPSELDIRANAFFIGSETTSFVSGSGGNIEISSSNFHLQPDGDVIMSGEITAEAGTIGGFTITDSSIEATNIKISSTAASMSLGDKIEVAGGTDSYIAGGEHYGNPFGIAFDNDQLGFVLGIDDDVVKFEVSKDDTEFLRFSSGGGLKIGASTFTLVTSKMKLDSATNNGKIALGATPPTSITTNKGFYADGNGTVLIGDADGSRISFDNTNLVMSASTFFLGSGGQFISGSNGNLKIFSTGDTTLSGSSINIHTPKFFFGDTTQFVSGSNGNIEISSSKFHLKPDGDVVVRKVDAEEGSIGGYSITGDKLESVHTVATDIIASGSIFSGTGDEKVGYRFYSRDDRSGFEARTIAHTSMGGKLAQGINLFSPGGFGYVDPLYTVNEDVDRRTDSQSQEFIGTNLSLTYAGGLVQTWERHDFGPSGTGDGIYETITIEARSGSAAEPYRSGLHMGIGSAVSRNTLSILAFDGTVSGSSISTGSFGHLMVGGGNFSSASLAAGGSGGSGISNVVEDTTPQLGGDLDLNSNDITGTGNIDIVGNITAQNFIVSSSVTSIEYQSLSGSTIFGDTMDDTHQITGSVFITGSTTISERLTATEIGAFKATGAINFDSQNMTNVDIDSGTITGITDLVVADGGTGVSTLTDGGVLLGSGTGAITAMAVLTDGQMIVGDGTTDPVAESGATLRTSIGVGTGDDVVLTSLETSGNISGSAASTGSFGQLQIDGKIGVGTTSNLKSQLHIYRDDSITHTPSQTAGQKGLLIEQDGTGDAVMEFLTTGVTNYVMGIDNSDSDAFKITKGQFRLGDGSVHFRYGPTGILTLEGTSARLGIGTNNTQANLHVVGSGLITTNLEVQGNISGSSTSTGSFGQGFIANKLGVGTISPHSALTGSSIHISNDGSTPPAAPLLDTKLYISNVDSQQGTNGAHIGLNAGTSDSASVYFGDKNKANAGSVVWNNSRDEMYFYSGSTKVMSFNNDQTIHLNKQVDVTGAITTTGGVHVGGTSDPGTDNLTVDGKAIITGHITGSKALFTNKVNFSHTFITHETGAPRFLISGSIDDVDQIETFFEVKSAGVTQNEPINLMAVGRKEPKEFVIQAPTGIADGLLISGSANSTGSFGLVLGDGSQLTNVSSTFTSAGISGSFTDVSSSLAGRITTEEGNVDTLQARDLIAGAGLTGGGTLASDRTFNVVGGTGITANANEITTTDGEIVHDNLSGFVANEHIDHSSVSVIAGSGLTGGGTIAANRTLNIGAGTGIDVAADAISVDVSDFMANGSNNRIITSTGTDAMNAEANLTFDGSTLNATGVISASIYDNINVEGTVSASGYGYFGGRVHLFNGIAIGSQPGTTELTLGGATAWTQVNYGKDPEVVHNFRGTMISGSVASTGSFGRLQITDTLLYDNAILDVGRSAVADPTVLIDSATGGDPQLHFDTGASNRSARIKFLDQGTNIGFINYVHNGDKMNFGAGSSTSIRMTVSEAAIEFPTANVKVSGSSTSTGSFGAGYIDNKLGIGTTSPAAKLDINGDGFGGSTSPGINLTTTTSATYNHSINAFNANLTAGEANIIVFGVAGSTKNSGYIGYKYSSAASNDNVVTFGHWGSNHLMELDGVGNLELTAGNISGSATSTGSFGRVHVADDVRFGGPDADGRIGYLAADGFGFDTQHNQLTFITNDQGDTNQAIVLGDTTPNSSGDDYTFFGIAGSTNAGGAWTKLLNLDGLGNLDLSGGVSGSATSTGSFGLVKATKLVGNGSGLTNLPTSAISPAGSDEEIQFNEGGTLGSSANLKLEEYGSPAEKLIIGSVLGIEVTTGNISGSSTSTGSFGMVTAGVSTAQAKGKLHVKGSATGAALGIIEDTAGNANFLIKATAVNKNSILLFGDSASDEIGRIDYDHADNSMDLITNNSTALTINSSGDIGVGADPIGTHSALTQLTLGGNSFISFHTAAGTSNALRISQNSRLNSSGNIQYVSEDQASMYTQEHGTHLFRVVGSGTGNIDSNFTDALLIDNSGNSIFSGNVSGSSISTGSFGAGYIDNKLGIGIAAPIKTLHINSQMMVDHVGGTNPVIFFAHSGVNKSIIQDIAGDLVLTPVTGQDIRLAENGGKVGIGIASPDGELHVHAASAGTVTAPSEGNNFIIEDTATPGMSFLMANNSKGSIYWGCPADNDRMSIIGDINNNIFDFATRGTSGDIIRFRPNTVLNLTLKGVAGSEIAVFEGDVSGSAISTGSFGSVFINNQSNLMFGSIQTRIRGDNSNNTLKFITNNTERIRINDTAIQPGSDDATTLGTASLRFSDVFATQTTTGGIFETGLKTKKIGDNPTGTIVSWKEDGLVPCDKNEDELVMGVIKKGKDEPIVLGAEPVLVTGKVNVGDYIVTSDKIGHGKSVKRGYLLKKNLFGKVIAQALESSDNSDSCLIKCMIRKM